MFVSFEICKNIVNQTTIKKNPQTSTPSSFDSSFSIKHGKNAEHGGKTIETHIRIDQHVAETEKMLQAPSWENL